MTVEAGRPLALTGLELGLAGLLLLVGLRAAWRGLREPPVLTSARDRFLVSLYAAAKAGFWLALSAWFLGLALLAEPQMWRWFILVPIGMAGLRLAAATFLSRG